MEISDEVKAKVFAQYWGQRVAQWKEDIRPDALVVNSPVLSTMHDNWFLALKNLTDITDEDAIRVINMLNNNVDEKDVINGLKNKHIISEMFKHDTEYISSPMYTIFAISMVQQYLQSQGYDVPNYYLDGKTCIEAGIAVYIKTLK